MKKSQLRKIIKESIKELMREDITISYNSKKKSGKCRCKNGQVYTCQFINNATVMSPGGNVGDSSCCELGPRPSWCLDGGEKVMAPGSIEVTPSIYKNIEIKTTLEKSR